MSNIDYDYHAEECDCGKDCTFIKEGVATIRADGRDTGKGPIHYKTLNCAIRKAINADCRTVIVEGVMGQRYIGATATGSDLLIVVHGTPGNGLGAFLNGPTIEVLGNAQDMTGNTMNSGKIIVHGNAWDVTGLSARGGTIMIKGSSGYRVGIHMKEFSQMRPSLVIGGTVKDYLGEYMAGGTILVLGLRTDVRVAGGAQHRRRHARRPHLRAGQGRQRPARARRDNLTADGRGYCRAHLAHRGVRRILRREDREGLQQIREDQPLVVQAVQRLLRQDQHLNSQAGRPGDGIEHHPRARCPSTPWGSAPG